MASTASASSRRAPGRPVAAHHRGRGFGQKQRLVAHARGAVRSGVDEVRPALAPAIAARQEAGPDAAVPQQRRELQRDRRLARPAHGEIAHADDRQLAAVRFGIAEALLNGRAIERRDRQQPPGGGRNAPEYHQDGGSSRSQLKEPCFLPSISTV